MVNGIERPLDVLNNSKGKEVLVQLKNNRQMVGTLLAFDIHINVVLDNAKEIVDKMCNELRIFNPVTQNLTILKVTKS